MTYLSIPAAGKKHVASDSNRNSPSGEGPYDTQRRETIRADLVLRLRHACAHLSDEEFSLLIDSMVERQLKGELRKPFG